MSSATLRMVVLLSVATECPQETASGRNAPPEAGIEVLIDDLLNVSNEDLGYFTHWWRYSFSLVIDEEALQPDDTGVPPSIPKVLSAIVRHGAAAIPALLSHLDDARLTKLEVSTEDVWNDELWYSNEYDPRHLEEDRWPPDVSILWDWEVRSQPPAREYVESHHVRVGDLCYVAIGLIVNRDLELFRYASKIGFAINSPVSTPALAAAVRQDWSEITADAHRQSLTVDANEPFDGGRSLQRLCFFYPDAGERIAVQQLSRRVYPPQRVEDFLWNQLAKVATRGERAETLDEFRGTHGDAAGDAVALYLHWSLSEPEPDPNVVRTPQPGDSVDREVKESLLNELFPGFDPNARRFVELRSLPWQEGPIAYLSEIRSESIDRAIYQVFQEVSPMSRFAEDDDTYSVDRLAERCFERLSGGEHDDEFIAYCEQRIESLSSLPVDHWNRQYLPPFKDWLARLEPRP